MSQLRTQYLSAAVAYTDLSTVLFATAGTRYYFQNTTNTPIRISEYYSYPDEDYRLIPAYGDTISIVQGNISFDTRDLEGHILAWVHPSDGTRAELAVWTENPTT